MFLDFREREGNTDVREKHQLVAFCVHPNQGSNLQPRYVRWVGSERTAFLCSNQLSHLARSQNLFFKIAIVFGNRN